MKELAKAYEPNQYEDQIYTRWETSGLFSPDHSSGKPFSIMMPPPNVTGVLHLGHALENTLMDVMARYQRMHGKKVLLLPGTDHAAVATQARVEKMLKEQGVEHPRETFGRDTLIEKIREFAEGSKKTILSQIRKMGTSCDWSRLAYTFDDARSAAVNEVFVKMYHDELIYRGYRVVNWSVKGQSTCSDDELVYVERPAKLYTFKYSKDFPITIATTRPETKLGDTAVAVHPNDERYQKYIGQTFIVDVGAEKPLEIRIIADEGVDPNFGVGALGVTPAHSQIDFEMYEKQKAAGMPIDFIQVIGNDGRMTAAAGKAYAGLTVAEAREKFVAWLRENDLLEKEEDIVQNVGTSDRFGDVVEAVPMTQWFVAVNKEIPGKGKTLKDLMRDAVKTGHNGDPAQKITITPDRFEKIYEHWIDNLRDWCISRQIWWGHRIPVWYRGDEIFCGTSAPAGDGWERDEDTLDTWFSSGLWTFSTLGWPLTTVHFVRHGEAENNIKHLLSDATDATEFHLTDLGKTQVQETAQKLRDTGVDVIITSPVLRTRETAEIISRELGGVPIIEDVRLREVGMGKLNGKTEEELQQLRSEHDWMVKTPYSGEPYSALRERTHAAMADVLRTYRGKRVVVVSHGDTLAVLRQFGTSLHGEEGWDVPKKGSADTRMFSADDMQRNDVAEFHPTNWMQMGHEILPFWMARMILMTTYTLDQIPFRDVYIHGILRDEQGRKFSKSLGNGIDPLDVIKEYGTDALRFSLISGITPGNDSRFYMEKVEGARNLVNKIWNICRYMLMSIPEPTMNAAVSMERLGTEDKWFLLRIDSLISEVTKHISEYNFSLAAEALRECTWTELADWYLETAKVHGQKSEMLNVVMNTLLKLWHPYIPFVTEQIWSTVYGENAVLMIEAWPKPFFSDRERQEFETAQYIFRKYQEVVTAIRTMKNEYHVVKAAQVTIVHEHGYLEEIQDFIPHIQKLSNTERVLFAQDIPTEKTVSQYIIGIGHVHLHLEGQVDLEKEKIRIQKEIDTVAPYVTSLEKKLSNEQFVQNAPATVVDGEKKKLSEAKEKLEKLQAQLASLT